MSMTRNETNYRWYILILAALTDTLLVAIPSMCLPVLFKEISSELHLDLVQVGLIWGIGSLPSIVTVLVGGAIGDRWGPKRVLTISCLLVGLSGALRGLSQSYEALAATVFLFGLLTPVIPMNAFKVCSVWFSRRQLGLASGVVSMGMALGFMLGSMISGTFLSPWLGGWRNVLIVYGLAGMALGIPWYFTRPAPDALDLPTAGDAPKPLLQAVSSMARIGKLWLFGWTILGFSGCIQGALGYLPLYLRGIGWPEANADGALGLFNLVSMICVVPIALWSDRLGSRKKVLMAAMFMVATGVGLLSVANGVMVWVAVSMAGLVRDGFMAVFLTMIVETEGVGVMYAGTATGLVMVFSSLGNLVAPPLGNSLAETTPGLPFVFWAALTVLGIWGLFLIKEGTAKNVLAAT
jgi:NNP family nitrate/nitrite transporter-like MFS transporter